MRSEPESLSNTERRKRPSANESVDAVPRDGKAEGDVVDREKPCRLCQITGVLCLAVDGHASRKAADEATGVALDVAFRSRYPARSDLSDIRRSAWITVPELPWPLRFDFIYGAGHDGGVRKVCVGFEIGEAIESHDLRDTDDYEVTMARLAILMENFSRYRQLAEATLIPSPPNLESAARIRTAMGRRRRRALTDDYLAGLVAEWRERRSERDLVAFATDRKISRSQLHRQLEEAEKRGMIPEGLRHRSS